MTAQQEALKDWINQLIADDQLYKFYKNKEWKKLSADVLKEQKHECQICKAHGRYTKAILVHHVNYIRRRPELALSRQDELGRRNLIAVCADCHEKIHKRKQAKPKGYTNAERW